jgi:hypothetical protein
MNIYYLGFDPNILILRFPSALPYRSTSSPAKARIYLEGCHKTAFVVAKHPIVFTDSPLSTCDYYKFKMITISMLFSSEPDAISSPS